MSKFPKFTVDINGARGAFDTIEKAKKEAQSLAGMNAPDKAYIEDENGNVIYYFQQEVCPTCLGSGGVKMFMTIVTRDTVVIDNDT